MGVQWVVYSAVDIEGCTVGERVDDMAPDPGVTDGSGVGTVVVVDGVDKSG